MKNLRKILPMFLSLILIMPILNNASLNSQNKAYGVSNQENYVPNSLRSIESIINRQAPYIDPDLTNAEGLTRVVIITNDDANLTEIAEHMISCRATPSINGFRLVLGTINVENIGLVASNTATLAILKDKEIGFVQSSHSALLQGNFIKNMNSLQPEESEPEKPSGDTNSHNPTMREVVNIMNATKVWDDYGVTGDGVTIAIIDTGVDYGSLGLGYWDVIARDSLGYPTALDADATCLVYTNTTLVAFTNASGTFIPTAGLNPQVYVFNFAPYFSELFGDVFPSDMNVTGILTAGQSCHWGIMFQWLFGLDLFPVLVVDSNIDGVYETVYVDMSFDWCWIPQWYNMMGYYWYWSATWPPDYSFTDEKPLNITSPVGARDFTGDGIFDISVSSLGYFLDVYAMSPNSDDRGLVLQPIDPQGNYVCFVYDFYGHGTACASSAAGRELGHPLFGDGIAYDAKIMGVTALYIGDIIEGELWAAGFDLIPGTEGWRQIPGYGYAYGIWSYTGNHKADIISNSWGSSAWALYSWMDRAPWYSVLTMLEDALTIPGYLDSMYPGTIVVHAGGNGGSGYGTFTEPGFSALAIGVGASTSMNWTQLYYGFAGGYYDDVISWSARGPTPLGTVKPDVLGVGAYGFAPTAVFQGLGDGMDAFWLFGGTSMATPLVAGSAALVIQGFREANLLSPDHEIVKMILKSTAVDLGYDPFLQGAGRVDCYKAVSLAMNNEGVAVFSYATWENVMEMIQIPAMINYEISDGLIPPYEPPHIADTSWFAGTVKPGENTSAEFTIFNPTAEDIAVNVSAVTHKHIGQTMTIESVTEDMPTNWTLIGFPQGNITILNKDLIPTNAELMSVSLTFPYAYFDPDKDYTWDQRLGIIILDWNDTNSNGNVETDEVWQINYGYDYGTSNEVKVGFPHLKFRHTPIILVYQRTNTGASLEYIPFKLHIRFYERATWDWIELSQTAFTVTPDNVVTFNATLTVSSGTPQGVYEGQLIIIADYIKLALPISVNVPTLIPTGELVYNIDTQEYEGLYNPFVVEGYFDWGWRYEAGDWKNWLFEFDNPSTIAAFIHADWEGNMSDVDMFAIHPMGIIMDGTGDYWSGTDGIFFWNTRTGTTEEYVAIYTGQLPFVPPSIHIPELYTVLLHNVLFDGTVFPENISCSVRMINVDPASPADLVIQPGESKSMTFTLSTGVRLTNVGFYPSAPFPIEVNPLSIAEIPEMGSQTFNVTVQVPADAPIGKYLATVYLVASEFPSGMGLPIYIYVDVPTVKMVDVKIDVGKIHFPAELAQLYIMTTLNASFVDTMDGIQTTLWYRTTSGSYLSLDLSSEVMPISLGLYSVEFEVPINATSCCLVVQIAKYVGDDNVLYRGVSMTSFDISSTLNNWNAHLQSLIGDIATIKTDVGIIKANLTSINATLSGLITNSKNELIATISTSLGILQADLDDLNATLLNINENMVEINTRLGNIETSLETIGLKVEWIEGNVTIIKTSLGDDIRGVIETIDDNVATIKTDIGQIKVNVEDIEGYTASTSQTTAQNLLGTWAAVGLSLIAAICSATVLILIRKKPKP